MRNKIILVAVALVGAISVTTYVPAMAATSPADEIQKGVNGVGGSGDDNLGGRIKRIVNLMLYLLGAIAVIMIVIGGIRYTTSNGDSSQLTSAKNTILYAVVGLVVAIFAYAIVNFVIDAFTSK